MKYINLSIVFGLLLVGSCDDVDTNNLSYLENEERLIKLYVDDEEIILLNQKPIHIDLLQDHLNMLAKSHSLVVDVDFHSNISVGTIRDLQWILHEINPSVSYNQNN